jgi:hypothetical protein
VGYAAKIASYRGETASAATGMQHDQIVVRMQ